MIKAAFYFVTKIILPLQISLQKPRMDLGSVPHLGCDHFVFGKVIK